MKIKNKEFEPSQEHEGCYVYGDGSEDSETAESEALALQSEALRKGYYCVCGVVNGEGYGLYLVPKNGIQSVIEL
ncbi:MAG: hypothetical protein JWM04_1299, partial [Verrucomicrobiales bacterium]|nr:hypothetical protein [Verrucomicrobiales bacterium]